MEEKSQVIETAVDTTAQSDTGEKKTLGQKIKEAVTGKKNTDPAQQTANEPTAEDKVNDAEAGNETITAEQMNAAIEKARQDAVAEYQKQQEEAARKAAMTPEELKAEEDASKDKELEKLRHDLVVRDCKDAAIKELDKAEYPVELADILDYTSEDSAKESLGKVMKTFADCLEKGIKERLKGKTPNGLNATNDINDFADRQAKMRKAMGIKNN